MDEREERIIVETEHHRLVGTLKLPREGYRSRLTDYLNAGERDFIALTDVEITPANGGTPERRPYVALSRRHIVLATPLDGTA
jgi:hypothetical protein